MCGHTICAQHSHAPNPERARFADSARRGRHRIPPLFDFVIVALYNLPMTRTVNEKRAKTVFAELVGRVSSKKDTVIVEQHGKPVVAMIDFDRYQLLTSKRERRFNVLDRVWAKNRAKSARTAYQDATQAVNLVRSSSSRSHRRRSA